MAVRIDGQVIDMEPATRGFTLYDSNTRASMAASFRLGHRQRQSVGEAWWTHPLCPGVCFPTRIEAHRAALRKLAIVEG